MIVGLSGYAKAGKDTAAKALIEHRGFIKVAFADSLRNCLYALNPIIDAGLYKGGTFFTRYADSIDSIGYEKTKSLYPEARELLQRLGTEAGRNILGENVWVNAALDSLELDKHDYVFTDVRFPNEFNALKALDAFMVRVIRPNTGPVNNHPSETALDSFYFDMNLENGSSIEDLHSFIVSEVDRRR